MKTKKIYIPHLHYTVLVKKFKNPPEGIPNAKAYVQSLSNDSCCLFVKDKYFSPNHSPNLAHELIHVLQFICLARNIDFTLEQEHIGYLMQWIMGEILGSKWESF